MERLSTDVLDAQDFFYATLISYYKTYVLVIGISPKRELHPPYSLVAMKMIYLKAPLILLWECFRKHQIALRKRSVLSFLSMKPKIVS